jgi:hypothetical protein
MILNRENVQTKCAPYTLETLINNIMAEWARNGEGEAQVWVMVGVLVRVALQMGYHRSVFLQVLVQRLTPQITIETHRSIQRLPFFRARCAAESGALCKDLTP